MHRLVAFGRVLADATAVRVLVLLAEHRMTIEDLCAVTRLPRHIVDGRLTKLREAELLDVGMEGRWLVYTVRPRRRAVLERLFHEFYEDMSWEREVSEDARRMKERAEYGRPLPV